MTGFFLSGAFAPGRPARLLGTAGVTALLATTSVAANGSVNGDWALVKAGSCSVILNTLDMDLEPDGKHVYDTNWPAQIGWSGPCSGGLAHGNGTLTITVVYAKDRFSTDYRQTYTGMMRDGIMTGPYQTIVSNRTDGQYKAGAPHSYTFVNGCSERSCDLADARPLQARFKAAGAAAPTAPVAIPPTAPDVAALQGRAERGDATAQFGLAERFINGTGIVKDLTQAIQWYRRAADQGHDPAQFALGLMYRNGDGVVKDFAQAAQWFLRAGEQGNAEAQLNLGFLYGTGQGVTRDNAQAVQWFRRAADQDHDIAQFALGVMYRNGDGVVKDLAQAAQWLLRAAQKDNVHAQTQLAHMYSNGEGMARNDAEAVRWYSAAAAKGDALAQNDLGWMYEEGRGLQRDDNLALQWYRRAADQGQVNAQTSVGFMYASGRGGLQQDHVQAVQWYRRAADQGFAIAQANLGFAYEKGEGVPKDLAEAARWFRLAADQGNAKAREALDRLSGNGHAAAAKAPIPNPAADDTPSLDRSYITGKWGKSGDCASNWMRYTAEGRMEGPASRRGQWFFDGGRLIYKLDSLDGNYRPLVELIDQNRMRLDYDIYVRCGSIP